MRAAAAFTLLVWSLSGCSSALPAADAAAWQGDATMYVVGRGWHTDIGLPMDETAPRLATLAHDFPGVRVLVFGFGERAFVISRETRSGDMLAALFPSKSAILLTALNAPPQDAFGADDAVTLHVSRAVVERIASRIWQTLELDTNGKARPLGDGPYQGSVFYAGNETYDAFHTCNTWTALVLRDAGLPVDPNGVLFAGQVMRQARRAATR